MRLTAVVTTLCVCLAGCADAGHDAVLKRAAAGRSEDGLIAVTAGTPRDGLAMQAARDRTEQSSSANANAPPPADLPAVPNAEQITIVEPSTFAGNWRMISPTSLTAHFARDATYERVQTFICRFEQHASALSGACLPSRRKIEGSIEGDRVMLEWSRGLASAGMVGKLLSPTTFRGTLSVGALGVTVSTDIPAYGSKFGPPTALQDADQIAGQVLAELVQGTIAPGRFTAAALARFRDAPLLDEDEKRALGAPIDQFYLDRINVLAESDGSDRSMIVYEMSFEQGWRLCGVLLDAARMVDGVECS